MKSATENAEKMYPVVNSACWKNYSNLRLIVIEPLPIDPIYFP